MICRSMSWPLVLMLGLCVLFPVAVLAAGDETLSRGRTAGTGETPVAWSVQTSVGYLPSADLHAASGDVTISDYRLKIARNIRLDERITLNLGGGYGLKHVVSSPAASLPRDLHALFLETGVTYRINDKAFASLKLYPGFYSDFKDPGEDDLRMPALALAGYSFDNGMSVIGGFLYRFGYYANPFIPVLGVSYQPNQTWRFDLVAPRPGITYVASRQLQLFVAGDFASDEYELKDRSFGAKAIRYGDYKGMAGFTYVPTTSTKLTAAGGYAFERRFVFYDSIRPDLRMDDVPFFKVSLDVSW